MEKNPEAANNTETNDRSIGNANSSQSEAEQEASTSSAVFNRSKKNVKRRSYRQQNPHSDENDSSSSNVDESKPGSSNTNLKDSEQQSQQQTLQTTKTDAKNSQTTKRKKRNPVPDGSDASSVAYSDHETDTETSDEWTTSEEEKCVIPGVLNKVKPKPTLNIIKEIAQRQIGPRVQFERKFYGSLYMVERLQYLHSLDEHRGCVNSIEFNAKGDLLVSGSDDLAVIVWNWATGKKCRSYVSGHRNNIFQASWLPREDLSLMVTCASDGQVRLLDLNNGSTRKLAAHRGTCNRFTLHPDHPYVAISVGDDGQVLSIDVRDGETTKLVMPKKKGFPIQLYSIHSNPQNSNEFCVAGRSELVRIYDRRKPSAPIMYLRPRNVLQSERVYVTAVTYNYNGTEILASYNNDDIYLFDTLLPHPDGDYAHKYQGHRNNKTIKGVSYFGPESEFIVSGSDCGSMYIWEKNTEAIVQYLPADAQGVVNFVRPHPHIPILASSGLDDDVKIWVPSATDPPSALSRTGLRESVISNLRHRLDNELAYQTITHNLFYDLLDPCIRSNNRWSETSSDEDDDDE